MTALEDYAGWLAGADIVWTANAQRIAHDTLRDAIGCLVAGASEPATRAIAAGLGAAGTGAVGACTVACSRERLSAPWAALVNGTAAHALDFDDNYTPAMAHASAVLLPALLAAGELRDANGAALVDAFLAGLEVMAGLGYGMNPIHRQRGWHATSTIGTLGAASAVARLWRLPPAQTLHALALACSLCGGTMQQFGTDAKPLHAGLAAQGGVLAALWAQAGVTAAPDALDGPYGLQRLLVGHDLDTLREQGTGLEADGFNLRFSPLPTQAPHLLEKWPPVLKRWPNCASAHPAMQLALALREGIEPDVGDRLMVWTRAPYLANLRHKQPRCPAEARFSLEHAVALAWWRGRATLADFEQATLDDLGWRQLMARIGRAALVADHGIEARIELQRQDGTVMTATLAEGQLCGEPGLPIPEVELREKFLACMRLGCDEAATMAVERWLADPRQHRVADLALCLQARA